MEQNYKRNKSKNLIIFLALLAIITSVVISGTFARYTSSKTGDGTAPVAKWSFKVNGLDNAAIERTTITDHIVDGKIAPGTTGKFNVEVDATGCEVALEYEVRIMNIQNKPTNLKFYEDEACTTELTLETVEENEEYVVKGVMLATEIAEAPTKEISTYWKWEYETTGGDTTDTDEGKQLEQMSFDVKVTGTQILEIEEKENRAIARGETINYSITTSGVTLNDWKIFDISDDGNTVYMAYGDYLPNSVIPDSVGLTKENTYGIASDSRENLVNALTTSSNWEFLLTSELKTKGAVATGSPTVEQFVHSWNASGYTPLYTQYVTSGYNAEGYLVGTANPPTTYYTSISNSDSLYFPHTSTYDGAYGYWLASLPAFNAGGVMRVLYNGNVGSDGCGMAFYAARPIVTLSSSVLSWNAETSQWDLNV